jgi:hypothetical protein
MAEKGDVIDKNFGVVIAFWLPGFLLLWGLAYSFPQVSALLPKSITTDAPTVGGFLYVALASLAVGLIVSAIRWMIVDAIMHWTGVRQPNKIDYGHLKDKDVLNAFEAAVENHYRYYQYYSNSLVSVLASLVVCLLIKGTGEITWFVWVALLLVCLALFFGSRDSLQKYYTRIGQIVRPK